MNNFELHQGNCLDLFSKLDDNSIDICITDPPYFIDGMSNGWDVSSLEHKLSKAGEIGGS